MKKPLMSCDHTKCQSGSSIAEEKNPTKDSFIGRNELKQAQR